ncbi:MAG: glycosyltransferase family 39 protein [Candidatus Omnitrophica bacterium]|nr:glycosyltransferase family 39 protein [Candidatus Omnitrophota bacterium]
MDLRHLSKEAIIVLVLVLALFGLYSLDRVRLGHSIPDEKRYIQSTKEMVESGDYVTPRYHGKLRFQKPILFYWLIMLSYKIWGVGIYGARFPSILASLGCVVLIYLIGASLFNRRTGLFSAFILSTSEVYFMYSRFSTPDMTFYLFMTASVYLFIKAYRGDIKGGARYLYMYIPMGLAMLTKGPLGFFYPIFTVCLFLAMRKEWKALREIRFPLGLLIFAAVSAPWFIVMTLLHGDAYIGNVWTMEIMKKVKYFSSGTEINLPVHYFKASFYYIGMLFARHLPWSLFLPASLVTVQRYALRKKGREWGLTLIAAWCIAVFISLVLVWSKESYYVLALSVPVSLLLGRYFSSLTEHGDPVKNILYKLPFLFGIAAFFLGALLWLGFVSYVLGEAIFSLSLLMLAVPAFMLYAYLKKNRTLLPISFFAASFAFFAYFAGYIVPTAGKEPLEDVTGKIRYLIKQDDSVGVASSEVSYNRLNALLEEYKVVRVVPSRITLWTQQKDLIVNFILPAEGRVFCVITKDDYYEYLGEGLRERLYILDEFSVWKKFHKQDMQYFLDLTGYIFEGKRDLLRHSLKERVFLISNKE